MAAFSSHFTRSWGRCLHCCFVGNSFSRSCVLEHLRCHPFFSLKIQFRARINNVKMQTVYITAFARVFFFPFVKPLLLDFFTGGTQKKRGKNVKVKVEGASHPFLNVTVLVTSTEPSPLFQSRQVKT